MLEQRQLQREEQERPIYRSYDTYNPGDMITIQTEDWILDNSERVEPFTYAFVGGIHDRMYFTPDMFSLCGRLAQITEVFHDQYGDDPTVFIRYRIDLTSDFVFNAGMFTRSGEEPKRMQKDLSFDEDLL